MRKRRLLSLLLSLLLLIGICPTSVFAADTPELWVNGVDIIAAPNNTVACGDGEAIYHPAYRTLTLVNATIENSRDGKGISAGSYFEDNTLVISLTGTNVIAPSAGNDMYMGICTDGKLIITGNGSIDITTETPDDSHGTHGIYSLKGCEISGVTVDLTDTTDPAVDIFTAGINAGEAYFLSDGSTIKADGYEVAVNVPSGHINIDNSRMDITNAERGINGGDVIDNYAVKDSTVNCSVSGDNAVALANGRDILIDNSKLTLSSTSSNAIFSDASLKIVNGSEIEAIGYYPALFGTASITIDGSQVEAVSTNDIGIFSRGLISLTGGQIHAKGGPGLAAIAARAVKTTDEAAEPKITLSDLAEKNGGKIAFSDWFLHSGGQTRSWTSFVANDAAGLQVNANGLMTNALNEVWLNDPTPAPVCKIGTAGYATLEAALDAVKNGETITLLQGIDHKKAVAISKSITFDLGSHILLIDTSGNPYQTENFTALTVSDGCTVTVQGTGQFNVKGLARGVWAVDSASIIVHNAETTSSSGSIISAAAHAQNGGKITVLGNAAGYLRGAAATNTGSSSVTVKGDAIATATNGGIAVLARYGSVIVEGNATVSGTDSTGADANSAGRITVDGTITGETYIQTGTVKKTADQFISDAAKPGYRKYTDGTSIVWVKEPAPSTAHMVTASAASLTPIAGVSQTITLTVKDSSGNTDTTFTGVHDVTLSGAQVMPGGSGCGSFYSYAIPASGTLTKEVIFTNGVATPSLSLFKAGAQTISFSIADVTNPSASVSLTVAPGTPASMELTQEITAPAVNGGQFASQPVLKLTDSYANLCTNDSTTQVTVSKYDAGDWQLTGTVTVTAVNGIVTFTDLGASNTAQVTGAQLTFTANVSVNTHMSVTVTLPAPASATYLVTVQGGTGGGDFAEGATVNITAGTAPAGKEFDKWTSSDGVTFADANAASTSFVMPGKAVTVTATYKDLPDTTPPTGQISVGTNKWNSFWNTVTFGLLCKNTQTVSITGEDDSGETGTAAYYLSETELTSEELASISWQDYSGAFNINPNSKKIVYAKLTDPSGNNTFINSAGIVVYTDSVAVTTVINHVKGSGSKTAEVTLNGNTIAKIMNDGATLTSGTDYTVSGGIITLTGAWLDGLSSSTHTLTVYYNPLGVAYPDSPLTGSEAPATTSFALTVTDATPDSHAVTVQNDGNGTANASATSAAAGTEITLTATANSGYRFKEWQVVEGGVTITGNKFTMPAGTVTVKAVFEAIPVPDNKLDYVVDSGTGAKVEYTDGSKFDGNITLSVIAKPKDEMDKLKDNIDKAAKGLSLAGLYDIKLLKDGVAVQPDGKVKVSIPLTEEMKAMTDLKAVYIDDDGNATIIPSQIIDGKIVFTTDHFSYYGVIGKTKSGSDIPEIPQTGDNTPIIPLALAAVMSGITAIALLKRKKKVY